MTLPRHEESIIQFVDQLIDDAVKKSVSDIHIEPFEEICRIRFRRDGLLYEAHKVPLQLATFITARLKIMANLNIAERRLPQDGRILLFSDVKNKIDIRINTCPTLFGEKIVLRLLKSTVTFLNLPSLGMLDSQLNLLLEKISQPQGFILVTGPTGSGKTLTLYAILQHLNQIEKNISSVEDPVEIELKGINQINVHPKIGLDFASILRTLLRQDPDIIMVGEIRDGDTASIAIQAAQTGHLVLSTLHTNSALETLTRLQAMQIPDYHLAHSISLIIAQRLVRKLCQYCKAVEKNCPHCHQGYQGRIGIFECLPITESIRQCMIEKAPLSPIKNHPTLWHAAMEKVNSGITNLSEINRVLGDHHDQNASH